MGRSLQAAQHPLPQRVEVVTDAWFAYVESHPFAWSMLFRDTTGDPDIQAFHETMRGTARRAIAALLEAEESLRLEPEMIETTAELLRSAMTGLALWWLEHRQRPRRDLVRTVVETTWRGLAPRQQPARRGRPG
ncbi:MAG: hypothetical protein ACJ764_00240 [Solirubrobacteraceae bacterium]